MKQRPESITNINEYEHWLSENAAEGLHLRKAFSFDTAEFFKGEPMQMKYRVDFSGNISTDWQKRNMHLKRGWLVVTSFENYNIFSSPVELKAPEFYSSIIEKIDVIDKQLKIRKKWLIFYIAAIAAAILVLILIEQHISSLILDLTKNDILLFILSIIPLFLRMGPQSARKLKFIKKLRKSVLDEQTGGQNALWKKPGVNRRFIAALCSLIIIALVGYLLIPATWVFKNTAPVDYSNLPVVSLADIEQNSIPVKETGGDNTTDIPSYKWNLLAPTEIEIWASGDFHVLSYKLRFASMSAGIVSGLIKSTFGESERVKYTEVKNPNFDELIVYKDNDYKEVIAAKGKAVIWVGYTGPAQDAAIIKAIANKIDILANYKLTGNGYDKKYQWLWRLYN